MNSISEDIPRIFRNDDGELLSSVAPVLVVSVEKPSFRSKTTPIGEYRDYLGVADIKQQLAAQVNENKIKHDLLKQMYAENTEEYFKPIDAPVGSPKWKKEYSAQTAAYGKRHRRPSLSAARSHRPSGGMGPRGRTEEDCRGSIWSARAARARANRLLDRRRSRHSEAPETCLPERRGPST